MNKLATNYPTLGGWNGWWRGRRRRGGGRSGGVGGGGAEEEGKEKAERLVGEAKEGGEEEAEGLVVEERGAIYGGGGEGCNIWRWRRCGSREETVIECM